MKNCQRIKIKNIYPTIDHRKQVWCVDISINKIRKRKFFNSRNNAVDYLNLLKNAKKLDLSFFATYHLSLYFDTALTSKITRNSEQMLKNYYWGALVDKTTAENFFKILPSQQPILSTPQS